MAASGSSSTMRNFGINRAFALGQRKATEKLDKVCRLQVFFETLFITCQQKIKYFRCNDQQQA
jgi:hypothetical protein